jgi:hypothetical protein
MEFIEDTPRKKLLAEIKRRVQLKRSTLFCGLFGAGKSHLLRELSKQYGVGIINCCSSATQILGEMAGVAEPISFHKQRYLYTIKKKKGVYLLDEGQELPVTLFIHFKALIDAGCVFIIASKARKEDGEIINELEQKFWRNRHEDVLRRFLCRQLHDVELQAMEDRLKSLGLDDETALFVLNSCTATYVIIEVYEEGVMYANEHNVPLNLSVFEEILGVENDKTPA